MPPERLAPRCRQGRRGRNRTPGADSHPPGSERPEVEGVDTPSPDLPPQTVRRDLAARGDEGNNRAGEMTGHKFFEMRLKGAETLGVGKMNGCRLGLATRLAVGSFSRVRGKVARASATEGGGRLRRCVGHPPPPR